MIGGLLAAGLVLTAATQLRASALPVGPGELLLVAWLGMAFLRHVLCRPVTLNPALVRVGVFWSIMIVALCIGMIVGLKVEPFQDYAGMARDSVALMLVLSIGVMMAMSLDDAGERRRIMWQTLVFGSGSLLLQIVDGYGMLPLSPADPWYWDRLRGWAENPNQLGFFALIVLLIGLHLAESARTTSERVVALALLPPAFVAGTMSHSDSFIIGLMLSGALMLTLKSVVWVRNSEMAPTLRGGAVVIGVLALPLAVAAAVPFASIATGRIEQTSEGIYDDNDQGGTRLHLWAEAVEKSREAMLFGFGPGPHLTAKSFKLPPPNKFEAHNTPLDLLTQAGFIGVAAFLWLTGAALWGVMRAQLPALAGLVGGLLVFSMFHYTVRQPIFWFGIVLCLLEAAQAVPGRRRRTRAPAPDKPAPVGF